MGQANGYVLRLPKNREQVFKSCAEDEESFGEPVDDFIHSRSVPLICFHVSSANEITHIGHGRRGVKSGTGLRRLNVTEIGGIHPGIPVSNILKMIPTRNQRRAARVLENGGVFTPAAFEAVIAALLEVRPDLKSLLERYSKGYQDRIQSLPSKTRESLAFQKEAVLTALTLAKDPREFSLEWKESIQEWTVSPTKQPESFLEGLSVARFREDPMVIQDLTKLPGFDLVRTLPYNAAIFEARTTRVTVVLANRQPLEQQLGTDLIYFNDTFQCFVMVQYKAMETDTKLGDVFRIPNAQLEKEITQMDAVLAELRKCPKANSCDGFRLNNNPFFLKLCRRVVFNPDDVSQFSGMYLPLDYWRQLANDDRIVGPKGGKGIRYSNVGRYFDNTSFVSFVANSWIGSTPEQSAVLRTAIRSTLESGKAIAIAVKTTTQEEIRTADQEELLFH